MNTEIFQSGLSSFKQLLLNERSKRIKPSADKKIITAWNALAIKGLLDAYMALGDSGYLHNAMASAQFIEQHMLQNNGKLWRSYSGGKASTAAFLEDYAYLCDAFIQLYQSTFDLHWLLLSRQLAELSIKYFYDGKESRLFFSTDQFEDSRIHHIPLEDNSMPSANAVMAKVLYGRSVYFQNDSYL